MHIGVCRCPCIHKRIYSQSSTLSHTHTVYSQSHIYLGVSGCLFLIKSEGGRENTRAAERARDGARDRVHVYKGMFAYYVFVRACGCPPHYALNYCKSDALKKDA